MDGSPKEIRVLMPKEGTWMLKRQKQHLRTPSYELLVPEALLKGRKGRQRIGITGKEQSWQRLMETNLFCFSKKPMFNKVICSSCNAGLTRDITSSATRGP